MRIEVCLEATPQQLVARSLEASHPHQDTSAPATIAAAVASARVPHDVVGAAVAAAVAAVAVTLVVGQMLPLVAAMLAARVGHADHHPDTASLDAHVETVAPPADMVVADGVDARVAPTTFVREAHRLGVEAAAADVHVHMVLAPHVAAEASATVAHVPCGHPLASIVGPAMLHVDGHVASEAVRG